MKISMLIPCHNEERSIGACLESALAQSRPIDQILVVNDGSTDRSSEILREYEGKYKDKIEVLHIPIATGNKSYAQERGVKYIKGDIFIATDGDTILHTKFVELIEKDFRDPQVAAVGGYVRSLKHNWLTACRELDYAIGQDLHKVAQAELGFLFVIPGCAGAFRTDVFKSQVRFDHDTVTEDLDFTFRLHRTGHKIVYNRNAISYTQDPTTLFAYINQMRRWSSGGWQNLVKHYQIAKRPRNALELSLMFLDGLTFSTLLFLLPLININFFKYFLGPYLFFQAGVAVYAAITRRRWDLIFYSPFYIILTFINAYVFLEQFIKEVVFRKRSLVWFQPERQGIILDKQEVLQ